MNSFNRILMNARRRPVGESADHDRQLAEIQLIKARGKRHRELKEHQNGGKGRKHSHNGHFSDMEDRFLDAPLFLSGFFQKHGHHEHSDNDPRKARHIQGVVRHRRKQLSHIKKFLHFLFLPSKMWENSSETAPALRRVLRGH